MFKKDTFPFPEILENNLDRLNRIYPATKHDITKTPDIKAIPKKDLVLAFNYWKDVLSMECPEAFNYYESHEGQTRFYSGIFIASLVGFICSIIILVKARMVFYYPGLILFLLSAILIFTIGGQFRRVRKKEANVLMFQYIAYLQR